MKHCAGKVTPQHSLNNAVSDLTWQGERASHENNARIGIKLLGNKKLSSFKYCEKILVKSGSMFSNQWDEHKNYQPIKVKSYQWLVVWIKERAISLIPQFHRTYIVICEKGYFSCTCKYFELHGFACRHLLAVLSSCSDYPEPNHHDFAVCHWKEFHHYYSLGSPMNNNDTLRDQFEYLRNNDGKGPYHEPVSIANDEVVVSIPNVYESEFKFCFTNYEFSNVNYLSDFGGGYGCDVRQHITKNLSASFNCNFNGQETNVMLTVWVSLDHYLKD